MSASQNRTIVIAGASSGIGLATALAFARTGAELFLFARRADALEEAAEACRAAGSGLVVTVAGDVADADVLETLAQRAIAETGRLDVWVNMAGVGALGAFETVPMTVHRRIVETNLIGAMNGCHAALPAMLARGRGVIVNMASIGARVPQPFATAYTASKWGLAGFTDSLRHEVLARSRVQVCGVYPTVVDTPAPLHAGNWTGRVLDRMPPALHPDWVAARIVDLVDRPRRALNLGAEHALVPAFWLAPELAGRAFGRMTQRAFYKGGRRGAPDTAGALLAPVPQGRTVTLGDGAAARRRLESGQVGVAAGLAVGLVVLGGLLAGARHLTQRR
jgi:short-subunit dehydrogenase